MFSEQLSTFHQGSVEQQTSLHTLRRYYTALREKDESSSRQLSFIHDQHVYLQKQYKLSVQSLRNTREELGKYSNIRSILARMIVRRVDLCQLLYKKLTQNDTQIHEDEQHAQMACKCMRSLKTQIRQVREENKKSMGKKEQVQLEVTLLDSPQPHSAFVHTCRRSKFTSSVCLIILMRNNDLSPNEYFNGVSTLDMHVSSGFVSIESLHFLLS